MIGPNVKRLWAMKMAKDAIPSDGGLADGLKFLSSREPIAEGARRASEFVEQALRAVRCAAEPNEWKHATDEEIAGELLRRIEEREAVES
jgi:hypothetical protein